MASLDGEIDRFLQAWMQVRQIVQAANFNRFRRAGLSATQFMTLNVMPDQGLTLSDLSRQLNLSAASLKKTIDSLADRGLVLRQPRASDARKVDIFITPKGKRLQNTASGEFHQFIAGLFTAMSTAERRGLVDGLERLVQLNGTAYPTLRADADPPAGRSKPRSRRQ